MKLLCSVPGCGLANSRLRCGLCSAHYERWRTTGDVQAEIPVRTHGDDWKWFWDKVEAWGCWEWTASKTPDGYGHVKLDGKTQLAHRVSWLWLVGPIPSHLQIDHLCRNTSCVNPDHLELVTPAENSRRSPLGGVTAMHARKTACLRGHPLSGENLYIRPGGGRRCRMCDRMRYQAKKRTRT